MTGPDSAHCTALSPWEEAFAWARGYLLYIAEQHLDAELHAKGGASDLVQTALLAAPRPPTSSAATPRSARGWLRRILLNVLRKFRRRWRAAARNVSREVPLDRPWPGPRRHHQDTPSHLARQ